MLGSLSEADDAVQESWLRLSRSNTSDVDNLGSWLTTVVARVCLDMLRSRKARREEPLGVHMPDPIVSRANGTDPEHEALLADSVGLALLVVMDTLAPAERLAFVLHDMFDLPYGEIATIVARTPNAARLLASRARRRVQGAAPVPDADLTRQQGVVDAFLAASRDGDFDALVAVLDPDVVARADSGAAPVGVSTQVRGASGGRAGAQLRAALPVRTAGAGERGRGSRGGFAWTAVCGDGLHGHAREDRRNRHLCRPGAPPPARPDGSQRRMRLIRRGLRQRRRDGRDHGERRDNPSSRRRLLIRGRPVAPP
jgi:RNA polymerase sigma-70 factor, ECF subfamily